MAQPPSTPPHLPSPEYRGREKATQAPTVAPWVLLPFLVLGLIPAGCNRGTNTSTKSSILVYTALEQEQVEPLLAAFKSEHPDVDVQMVRDSTGVVTAKLLAEADNPRTMFFGGYPPSA